jgi:hypothetical protein
MLNLKGFTMLFALMVSHKQLSILIVPLKILFLIVLKLLTVLQIPLLLTESPNRVALFPP